MNYLRCQSEDPGYTDGVRMTGAGATPVECWDIAVQEAGVGEGEVKRVSLKTEVTCLKVLGPAGGGHW